MNSGQCTVKVSSSSPVEFVSGVIKGHFGFRANKKRFAAWAGEACLLVVVLVG